MIASQFILDQRLAELLQAGHEQVARPDRKSASAASRIGSALRSLFGGTTAVRPAGLVTH